MPDILCQTYEHSNNNKKNAKKSSSIDFNLIYLVFSLPTAGLRRSFRLSRKDNTSQQIRQKMGKEHAIIHLPIYQEVLPHRRNLEEPYRLVILTGKKYSCLKKQLTKKTKKILHHMFLDFKKVPLCKSSIIF